MSLGVTGRPEVASLRAMAHPVRLRILSLLTGSPMSAAEVARELDLTHANASYHLRLLNAAGLLDVVGEESIRGGRAKRYRHDPLPERPLTPDAGSRLMVWRSVADELARRARLQKTTGRTRQHTTDAELWVSPELWSEVVQVVHDASLRLHAGAQPPRTPGTVPVSASLALFQLREDER